MFSLGVLVSVLQPLFYVTRTSNSMSVWLSKLPSVLLVLEVVLRQQLLSLGVPCNSSAVDGDSPSFGSSGIARLFAELRATLAGLFTSDEDTGIPPTGLLMLLLGRADLSAGDQLVKQQLLQQVFCIAASQLKACRLAGTPVKWVVGLMPGPESLSAQQRQRGSREVRAVLAPRLVLLGASMHDLSFQVGDLHEQICLATKVCTEAAPRNNCAAAGNREGCACVRRTCGRHEGAPCVSAGGVLAGT